MHTRISIGIDGYKNQNQILGFKRVVQRNPRQVESRMNDLKGLIINSKFDKVDKGEMPELKIGRKFVQKIDENLRDLLVMSYCFTKQKLAFSCCIGEIGHTNFDQTTNNACIDADVDNNDNKGDKNQESSTDEKNKGSVENFDDNIAGSVAIIDQNNTNKAILELNNLTVDTYDNDNHDTNNNNQDIPSPENSDYLNKNVNVLKILKPTLSKISENKANNQNSEQKQNNEHESQTESRQQVRFSNKLNDRLVSLFDNKNDIFNIIINDRLSRLSKSQNQYTANDTQQKLRKKRALKQSKQQVVPIIRESSTKINHKKSQSIDSQILTRMRSRSAKQAEQQSHCSIDLTEISSINFNEHVRKKQPSVKNIKPTKKIKPMTFKSDRNSTLSLPENFVTLKKQDNQPKMQLGNLGINTLLNPKPLSTKLSRNLKKISKQPKISTQKLIRKKLKKSRKLKNLTLSELDFSSSSDQDLPKHNDNDVSLHENNALLKSKIENYKKIKNFKRNQNFQEIETPKFMTSIDNNTHTLDSPRFIDKIEQGSVSFANINDKEKIFNNNKIAKVTNGNQCSGGESLSSNLKFLKYLQMTNVD